MKQSYFSKGTLRLVFDLLSDYFLDKLGLSGSGQSVSKEMVYCHHDRKALTMNKKGDSVLHSATIAERNISGSHLGRNRILSISLMAILVISLNGCGQKSREEAERLQQENLALQQQLAGQEEAITQFLASINEIEENLALIREKERIISQGARDNIEGQTGQMERINDDIRLIGELMTRNRQLMNRLNRDLRNSNLQLSEFEKRVAQLNERLVEKEGEIAGLKEELGRMNLRVDYLTLTIDTLQQDAMDRTRTIEAKVTEINTAFYTMGSRKELLEWGLITRTGGFLGIGRTNRLMPDFDPTHFARIDIRTTTEITISGSQSTFITPHPEGTFEFRYADGIKILVILDPEKFWSNSRYLVVEISR